MKKYSALFKQDDGVYLATSNELTASLPPGLYGYNNTMFGMSFNPEEIEPSMIVLDINQQTVFDRIQGFWAARQKYQALNISHKRGFLLYGPPGTGKTTLIRYTIKDHINKNGIVIKYGDEYEFADALVAVKSVNGPETKLLVLIEDLEEAEEEVLSCALDGIGPMDNTLFIATTNYIDKVSKRLSNRPSRFDEKIEMTYPTVESRKGFIKGLIPKMGEDALAKIVEMTDGISQAHIKELIIQKSIFNKSEKELKELAGVFKTQCEDWKDEDEE